MDIDVKDIIPQRPPFLFIDKIVELQAGQKVVTSKKVTINEWFFSNNNSHFMPEPLLVEALAQTGACALLSNPEFKGKNAFFGGIKQAEFKKRVQPGDELSLSVELVKMKRQIGTGHGVITNQQSEIVLEADLTFIVG